MSRSLASNSLLKLLIWLNSFFFFTSLVIWPKREAVVLHPKMSSDFGGFIVVISNRNYGQNYENVARLEINRIVL